MAAKNVTFLWILFAAFVFANGCKKEPNAQNLIKTGSATLQAVKDFSGIFPNASHSLSTRRNGDVLVWNSESRLHQRYVVWMQFDVTVDGNGEISRADDPVVRLFEVSNVVLRADGRTHTSFKPSGEKLLTLDEWRRLVAAQGNFEQIGISLVKDQPVENFESAMP